MANIERFDLKTGGDYKPKNNSPSQTKTPTVSTPAKEPTKLSNWDENIAPILDSHPEIKDVVNYQTSKHIMRAVNGRYDNAMSQLKQDDPKAYETFKKFKNSSLALTNELKKIETGGFSAENFNKLKKDADAYYDIIRDTYDASKKKAWVMDDEARFLTPKQDEKFTQTPYVTDKTSNTSRVRYTDSKPQLSKAAIENPNQLKNESPFYKPDREIEADYESSSVTKAYTKLKSTDEQWRKNGLKKIQPITKSWTKLALQRIGEKTTDADTNGDALNLITDQLKHINKYKTTQDPDFAKKDQAKAQSILQQLNGKTNEQKYKILKSNAEAINNMTGRMGYFGNAQIFNQYKKSKIGSNLDFYPNSNVGKSSMDYYNMTQENGEIDMHIKNYRQFRKIDSDIRKDTKSLAKSEWKTAKDRLGYSDYSQKDVEDIYEALIDEKGNIKGYSTFLKDLGYDPKTGYIGKSRWDSDNNKYVGSRFTRLYNKSTNWDTPVNVIQTVGNGRTFLDKNGRTRNELDTYVTDKEVFNDVMKSVYQNFKKSYKKTFDNAKIKNTYETTLVDLNIGDEVNNALEFRGVNLKTNKDMRLKESSGPKQENVNKVFSLLFDGNGNVDTEKVTIFGTKDIKAGLYAVDSQDLENQKTKNETTLKEFLKDDNDHVTMTFFRNTNVPGQAAYQFYNPETKKSIMVYTPVKLIGKDGVREDLYMKTGRSPLDLTFKLKGELDMPMIKNDNGKPSFKSAKLKYDREKDEYYGETIYFNNEGNTAPIFRFTIPNASRISVDRAQKSYLNFLIQNKNKLNP